MYLFVIILLLIIVFYLIFITFDFQLFYHRVRSNKSVLQMLAKKFEGRFYTKAFFAQNHKLIDQKGKNHYYHRDQLKFIHCYNAVYFHSKNAYWEVFFHLVKDGSMYSEIMSLRVFPNFYKIKSQGSVERTISGISVLTNNRYLTDLLESEELHHNLDKLVVKTDDILYIAHNSLHFKTFVDSKRITQKEILSKIKYLNEIKNSIFVKDRIEY